MREILMMAAKQRTATRGTISKICYNFVLPEILNYNNTLREDDAQNFGEADMSNIASRLTEMLNVNIDGNIVINKKAYDINNIIIQLLNNKGLRKEMKESILNIEQKFIRNSEKEEKKAKEKEEEMEIENLMMMSRPRRRRIIMNEIMETPKRSPYSKALDSMAQLTKHMIETVVFIQTIEPVITQEVRNPYKVWIAKNWELIIASSGILPIAAVLLCGITVFSPGSSYGFLLKAPFKLMAITCSSAIIAFLPSLLASTAVNFFEKQLELKESSYNKANEIGPKLSNNLNKGKMTVTQNIDDQQEIEYNKQDSFVPNEAKPSTLHISENIDEETTYWQRKERINESSRVILREI